MYKSRCMLVLCYRVPRFAWLGNVKHIFENIIIRLSNKVNYVKRYVFSLSGIDIDSILGK